MADILQEFTIKVPRERVFEAMATPPGLDRWWTKSSTGEAKENAEYELSFGPGLRLAGKSHTLYCGVSIRASHHPSTSRLDGHTRGLLSRTREPDRDACPPFSHRMARGQ
jgi:hypothetical protein